MLDWELSARIEVRRLRVYRADRAKAAADSFGGGMDSEGVLEGAQVPRDGAALVGVRD